MKAKRFQKKLVLKKQTVANLKKSEMRSLNGGGMNCGNPVTYPPCDTFKNSCISCYV